MESVPILVSVPLQWLSVVRLQAITWANANPDLCRHILSLGHNELTLDVRVA